MCIPPTRNLISKDQTFACQNTRDIRLVWYESAADPGSGDDACLQLLSTLWLLGLVRSIAEERGSRVVCRVAALMFTARLPGELSVHIVETGDENKI